MSFSGTLRELANDRYRRISLRIAIAVAILLAWASWMAFARVGVYATSARARITSSQPAVVVESLVSDRLKSVSMKPGKRVRTGDVLATLESDAEVLQHQKRSQNVLALKEQLASLQRQQETAERGLAPSALTLQGALSESKARLRAARSVADLSRREAERAHTLHATGTLSESELQRLKARAVQDAALAKALQDEVAQKTSQAKTSELRDALGLEELRQKQAAIAGAIATEEALVRQLELDIERRTIRSPVDGYVAEVANFGVGHVVAQGASMGVVIPDGELIVEAHFRPSDALGRVRVGQRGALRLEGFAWTQYGAVDTEVTSVTSEIRDGFVRVELAVVHADRGIPLQHGLPGRLEIELERVPPYILVLRAAGVALRGSRSEPPAQ